MFNISAVPCFDDNYIWVLRKGRNAIVVDPGDASTIVAHLQRKELQLTSILVTHRHADHVGGVPELAQQYKIPVYGPASIACVTHPVKNGDVLTLLDNEIRVLGTPGHTHEHLSYLTDDAVFCGDTLFGAGCGRVFDADMAAMYASLMQLAALPPETLVCCAHEYTLSNLRFAQAVEPSNESIAARISDVRSKRARGEFTVPSTIGLELYTNPFLRCTLPEVVSTIREQQMDSGTPTEVFTALRNWKNTF